MNEPRHCPKCGAELPSDALEGLCPQCMARVVFGESESAAEKPEEQPAATISLEPDSDIVTERAGMRIGRYKMLEKIGEGGFGVVYMAEQVEPVQRKVALKVIKAGMDTKEVIARFEAERQALALMDHPNIAKVLDAGTTEAGRPYFVMELVRGIPITQFCDQSRMETAERLELFMQVCKAVQHAHQKGIIHRDIKPSNVLVTLHDGEPVPKVIDFGIAKALGPKLTEKTLFTGFAHLLGTPAYMSPEQAELSGLDIDTRSDIYSLGVLLYELLTGVTPFEREVLAKAAQDEIRRMIRETEPPKPSTRLRTLGAKLTEVANRRHTEPPKLLHLVRGDLDWIVMKCLEKDRKRRYETANGLAMDLQRHLDNEPVVACPPSASYRFKKLVRKHRIAVTVVAAFAVLLAFATIISTALALWANSERRRAFQARQAETAQRERAEESERQTTEKLWESYLAQARSIRFSGRPGRRFDSLVALAKAAAIRPSVELRNEAIACATLPDLRQGRLINAFLPVTGIALDPTFKRYAASDEAGNIVIRDISDDRELARMPGLGIPGWWIGFSPDGRFVTTTYHPMGRDFPSRFCLWNLATGKPALTLTNSWGGAFSPDEEQLIVHLRDKDSVVYELSPLRPLRHIDLGRLAHPATAFNRDGSRVAVSSIGDSDVRIVEVKRGQVLRKLAHPEPVRHLDWHPNGRWLACACADGNAYVWDANTGQELQVLRGHQMPLSQVRFNHRGDFLLTASWDSTVRLWDVSGAVQVVVMSVQRPLLQFSPDEKLAGLVEREGQYAVLEVNTAPECRSLLLSPGTPRFAIKTAQISSDGRLLVAGSALGIRIWDLRTEGELAFIPTAPVDSLALLPDQSALLVCGEAGLFLWPLSVKEGSEDRWQIGPPLRLSPERPFRSLSLTRDGRRLAASQYTSKHDTYPLDNWIIDLGSPISPLRIKGPANQGAAALSPDGRWLATGIWRGKEVNVWDLHTGKRVQDLPVPESAFFPKFSPDGRRLVAGTAKSFHCWEVGSWRSLYNMKPSSVLTSQPSTATFDPAGRMIAVFHRYNRTHLLDALSGRILATLDLDRHVPLCFSPDSGSLAMATEDGLLKLLDLRLIRRELQEMNLEWEMPLLPHPRQINVPERLVLTVVTN